MKLKPDFGLFLYMNLREFLPPLSPTELSNDKSPQSKEQRERLFYLELMIKLFTPGMSMRNERAGFFRCVFIAASEEEFELGLVRILRFVQARRG